MKAGTDAATMTSTLPGERRTSRPESAASVTTFWTMAKACSASESGREEASRRAFCILS